MSRFPLFSASIPMIGRKRLFDKICSNLTKSTPQHLSIVGPRYFGKTVSLRAVADKFTADGTYECVLVWDLGHQTPQSDHEFITSLRKRIAAGIKANHENLSEHLLAEEAGYDELREVVVDLGMKGRRILMIWDGVDRALKSGQLTRNLWDNLLELCRQKGLVLVTASRRKLQELIRDEKSVTSEFWQVFEVVRVGLFDEDDLLAFVTATNVPAIDASGLAEVRNWSGMIPVLVTALLNRVIVDVPSGRVTNEHVNKVAKQSDEQLTDILDFIYSDLSAPAADLFRHLMHDGNFPFASASKTERSQLIEMGLAKLTDSKLEACCRLLVQHVSASGQSVGLLGRLFSSTEAYQANIREVLEWRIRQLPRFDTRLFHLVEQGIEDIPAYPDDCLNNLTNIEDRALDLIWGNELEDGRRLPQEVINYWSSVHMKLVPTKQIRHVKVMFESGDNWTVPTDRPAQLSLLQLLTGSHAEYNMPKAKAATKDVYVLLNAIHSFRNRNQHADGQLVQLGVAIAAIMLCIELLNCLAKTIPPKN